MDKKLHLLIQSKCKRVPKDDSEKEMKNPSGILEYEYRKIREEFCNMTRKEFKQKYPNLVKGSNRNAIFNQRASLLREIMNIKYPIYVDHHYYGKSEDTDSFGIVLEENFEHLSNWRECHYYSLYENSSGEKAWLMTGGRYD